jgi:2-polyprenyl-3-methyl-5-hydroxy-6-metoxy-1,4-benzoquinol methylase
MTEELAGLAPATRFLVDAVLAAWPRHRGFLVKSFRGRDPETSAVAERVAGLVARLAGTDLDAHVAGYRWMCGMVLEEEMHFRRHGRYRHSSFAEVAELVYGNSENMGAYMRGLLLSQVLWSNHARSMAFYLREFLAGLPAGYRHLEVGPGHGLLLFFAADDPRCGAATAWEVSDTSISCTRESLRRLGSDRAVTIERRSILDDPGAGEVFDSIVISEVLEHLEQAPAALRTLRDVLSPGGRLYVNVPINSPAVDHVYLLECPEAALELVAAAGFRVERTLFAPSAGYTEERARSSCTAMSIVMIARPA